MRTASRAASIVRSASPVIDRILVPDRPELAGGAFAKDETDYGGQGVHAAARIGALAGASEILASQETLAGGAAGRHATIDAREVELKGISEPVRVVALDWRS